MWTEALPIGNSYMGGMIFGGIEQEYLQLNEATLYSGDPKGTYTSIDIRKKFKNVDQLFKEGKYAEDQSSIGNEWPGRNHQDYQPLGDLWIDFKHSGPAKNYRRSLDLATAVSNVQYTVNKTTFKREIFASYPNRVIVIKLATEGTEKINRGGFEVDIEWEDGKLKEARILSVLGGRCRIRNNELFEIADVRAVDATVANSNYLFNFINPGNPLTVTGSKVSKQPVVPSFAKDLETTKGNVYVIRNK